MLLYCHNQVKHIEKGINQPSVGDIYFTGDYLLRGVRIGIVSGMVALTVSFSFKDILTWSILFLGII